MSEQDLWENYRSWLFDDRELSFRLDLSRMGIPAEFMQRMEPAISQAFADMQALEQGAIANPDEQRQVGHYWLRAPDLAPEDKIGQEIRETQEKILSFARRVHRAEVRPVRADRFEHLLVVGIGGSALGPQFVADALGGLDDPMTPHFLDNTDPDGMDRVLGSLPVDRTLTVVVSKSGSTAETRNGMLETAEVYRAEGLEFGPHAVAITQDESKLDRIAREQDFLERFPMWDWVGGRTSELSAVGLLPAALQGFDVNAMLDGAAGMDRLTRRTEPAQNPAALLALAWHHAGDGKGRKDMVVLPYRDRLALFSRYLQQLVMESLGKEKDLDGKVVHQGIAVYGNKGSTDQHAYVQQLRDGVANFFATFIEVLHDREGESIEVEKGFTSGDFLHGFLLGTRRALFESGRPSMTVTIGEVSPRSVGMLIALYERAVGLYASLVRINAYHQPGVEAGKKAAAAVLALQDALMRALEEQGTGGATCEELAAAAGAPDAVETAFMVLERLAANPVRGVLRRGGTSAFDARYSLQR